MGNGLEEQLIWRSAIILSAISSASKSRNTSSLPDIADGLNVTSRSLIICNSFHAIIILESEVIIMDKSSWYSDLSNIKLPKLPANGAEWMYERLIKTIKKFEANLTVDKQAGGRLVSFHDNVFSIDNVSYWGPDMIIFYGTLKTGENVQLVQHISQVNLLLVAVPRKGDLSKPRRKIGFEPQEEPEQD